ncbi:alpha-N-acetylneuraminide alpha-2,8-sialyltransferase-like [Branchiostoma lanceolatum]|uniref:alpha-N-acetylneuraminide alpha-2,8-sialyltransferase-like n=1 Tax=Branchiostoma lanceolatum TaxID=7740 RepID=UPI003453074A
MPRITGALHVRRNSCITYVFSTCLIFTFYNWLTMDGPYTITIQLRPLMPWASYSGRRLQYLITDDLNRTNNIETKRQQDSAITTAFPDTHIAGFPEDIDAMLFNNTRQLKPSQKILSLLDTIDKNWTFRPDATERLRLQLEKRVDTVNTFVLHKNSTTSNGSIGFTSVPGLYRMTPSVYSRQPMDTPFQYKQYKTCSVVGSSGILEGSNCGDSINNADFVIRFNMPAVTDEFKDDVGIRTHLVTCNGDTVHYKFKDIRSTNWLRFFRNYMIDNKYGKSMIFTAPFNTRYHLQRLLWFQSVVPKSRLPNRVVFNDSQHKVKAFKFWRERGLKEKSFSSGFYMISSALSFCEEVTVYGFWPFRKDRNGRDVKYHYSHGEEHDGGIENEWHRMDREFVKLVELYKDGVIKLVTQNCNQTENS